jgi:transcriptional regulator with XRE-family HTH domain
MGIDCPAWVIEEAELKGRADTRVDVHLGRQLRRRRKVMGLTQKTVAGACGVRFQQIQKYECGQNAVPAARLWVLASFLEVPVSYFFEGLPRLDNERVLERTRELGGQPAMAAGT